MKSVFLLAVIFLLLASPADSIAQDALDNYVSGMKEYLPEYIDINEELVPYVTTIRGDINGDNQEDLVARLILREGKEKFAREWLFIAAFLNISNSSAQEKFKVVDHLSFDIIDYSRSPKIATIELADITNEKINIIVKRWGPEDPTCCPSIEESHYIELIDNKLVTDEVIPFEKSSQNKSLNDATFINETVKVGDLSYRVDNYEYRKTIGNDISNISADGIFLVVDFTIENLSKQPVTIVSDLLRLVDADSNVYAPSTDVMAELYLEKKDAFLFKTLPPKIPKKVSTVFEVPAANFYVIAIANEGDYKLIVLHSRPH